MCGWHRRCGVPVAASTPLSLVTSTVDLSIEPGSSGREIAAAVVESGVAINPDLLYAWFRLSGLSRQIRAGSCRLNRDTRSLLGQLGAGEEALRAATNGGRLDVSAGTRGAGKTDQLIKPDSKSLSADDIMAPGPMA